MPSQERSFFMTVYEKNQKNLVFEARGNVAPLPFWKWKWMAADRRMHGSVNACMNERTNERMKGQMMSDFRYLKNQELVDRLQNLVGLEKKTTAEIVAVIAEIDRRRVYLELGHTSLFSYLTAELGYTPASAQRRIDAARLLSALPELKTDLQTGALNLMQISVVSQSIRQKKKEDPKMAVGVSEKRELLNQLKGLDLTQTQRLVSQALDLKPVIEERKRIQQDESLRVELTLSKEQQKKLRRAREILSHKHPSLNWAELFTVLAEEFIKRRDPRRDTKCSTPNEKLSGRTEADKSVPTSKIEVTNNSSEPERAFSVKIKDKVRRADKKVQNEPNLDAMNMKNGFTMEAAANQIKSSYKRKAILIAIKREIFQRDQHCQWQDPVTKRKCESRFQLELDHIKPVWAGGKNNNTNLQILCRTHNQIKFRLFL